MYRLNKSCDLEEFDQLSLRAFDKLPNPVAALNPEGKVVACNHHWIRQNEIQNESWLFPAPGQNVISLLQQPLSLQRDSALRLIMAYKSVLNGKTLSAEAVFSVNQNNPLWFKVRVNQIEDSDYVLVFSEDITTEIELKQQLSEKCRRFQQLFQTELSGNIITDLNDNIIEANPSALQILGISEEELLQKKITDVIEIKPHQGSDDSLLQKTVAFPAEGGQLPVEFNICQFVEDGGKVIKSCIFKDISEQVSIQNKLQQIKEEKSVSEKFYRELFNSTPNAVAVIDREGKVADTNKSFYRIFGFSKEEAHGNHIFEILKNSGKNNLISKVFQGYEVRTETSLNNKHGEEIPVLLSKFPIHENGNVIAAFCVYVDLRSQKEHQQVIEKQLKEKEVLIQEVHHRVKNNLAIISGLISLESIYNPNQTLNKHLHHTQTRIHSIARIHELLYKNENLSSVDFTHYVKDLASSHSSTDTMFSVKENQQVNMNVNQAVPCGMLLNEITNQLISTASQSGLEKYHFSFDLEEDDSHYFIFLRGEGLANCIESLRNSKNKLASELISVLLRQLDGKLEVTNDPGPAITIYFKKRVKKGAHSTFLLD